MSSSCARSETSIDDGQDLVDAVTQGMLGERPLPRVRPDLARLVRMAEAVLQLTLELGQVAIRQHLLARLEERGQVLLEVGQLTGPGGGELEGARVDAADVVERMMMVQRHDGTGVDAELVTPEDERARH